MLRAMRWLVLLVLTALPPGCDGTPYPRPPLPPVVLIPVACPGGDDVSAMALGDINNDGQLDIVLSSSVQNILSVLVNPGSMGCPTRATYATGRGVSALAIGDVNGDGWADVVVASAGDNTVGVHLNKKDGTLQSATNYPVPAATALALADIDGMNGLDVVALSNGQDAARALSNTGGGMLTLDLTAYSGGAGLFALTIAQLLTKNPDLVLASAVAGRIDILSGAGAARWTARNMISLAEGCTPVAVLAADLDQDGRPDLIVPCHNTSSLSLLRNIGDYAFVETRIFAGRHPLSVAVAKLPSTSTPSLAVINAGDNTLQFAVRSDPTDFFESDSMHTFPTLAQPIAVAAGDMDGDTFDDLVVAHRQTGQILIFHSR